MSRFSGFAPLIALTLAFAPLASAEDAATAEELKALRAALEKQSKQLDALSEQLARLRIALEKSGDVPLSSPNATAPVEAPAAVPAAPPAAAAPEFSTDTPKAEPADGRRHVVIKGETLTSIAKQYGITITELKRANKNVDERKLQIGQTLSIPTPKTAEPPAEKKENP